MIAHGVHDRWSEIHAYDAEALESELAGAPVRAVPSGLSGDVVIGACLVHGTDPFDSGHKAAVNAGRKESGPRRPVGSLSVEDQANYFRPFAESCRHWNVRGVLLHDGLRPAVMGHYPWLTFAAVNPDGIANIERRWYAYRDWLAVNPGVNRVWFIDANDVTYQRHPFSILDANPPDILTVGVEDGAYRDKPFFADHLAHLPTRYGGIILGRHANRRPVSAGIWGGPRAVAEEVINKVCAHLSEMELHLAAHPPGRGVNCDMIAFGTVILDEYADRFIPFRIGGEAGPVWHGPRALELLRSISVASPAGSGEDIP